MPKDCQKIQEMLICGEALSSNDQQREAEEHLRACEPCRKVEHTIGILRESVLGMEDVLGAEHPPIEVLAALGGAESVAAPETIARWSSHTDECAVCRQAVAALREPEGETMGVQPPLVDATDAGGASRLWARVRRETPYLAAASFATAVAAFAVGFIVWPSVRPPVAYSGIFTGEGGARGRAGPSSALLLAQGERVYSLVLQFRLDAEPDEADAHLQSALVSPDFRPEVLVGRATRRASVERSPTTREALLLIELESGDVVTKPGDGRQAVLEVILQGEYEDGRCYPTPSRCK